VKFLFSAQRASPFVRRYGPFRAKTSDEKGLLNYKNYPLSSPERAIYLNDTAIGLLLEGLCPTLISYAPLEPSQNSLQKWEACPFCDF
tara:strand:- start:142 stop:405 length:264 start_codon:yes stop_codon:yes gene_type:complete